ncbi:MAG: hypothetical protein HC859_12695 [Bacteroidia bacterium]|nr:hypothetical protein [Bacteroidia bacterium]
MSSIVPKTMSLSLPKRRKKIDAEDAPAAYAQAQQDYAAAQANYDDAIEEYVQARTQFQQAKSKFQQAKEAKSNFDLALVQARRAYEKADLGFDNALATLRISTEYLGQKVADSTYSATVAQLRVASRTARGTIDRGNYASRRAQIQVE